jgi:hypothetical protein
MASVHSRSEPRPHGSEVSAVLVVIKSTSIYDLPDRRRSLMKPRTLTVVIASTALAVTAISPVGADGVGLSGDHTPSASCWGVASAQRASTEHDIGEHASAQSEPRLGLGNAARLFGFDSVADFGAFLATVDGLGATTCPGN